MSNLKERVIKAMTIVDLPQVQEMFIVGGRGYGKNFAREERIKDLLHREARIIDGRTTAALPFDVHIVRAAIRTGHIESPISGDAIARYKSELMFVPAGVLWS